MDFFITVNKTKKKEGYKKRFEQHVIFYLFAGQNVPSNGNIRL